MREGTLQLVACQLFFLFGIAQIPALEQDPGLASIDDYTADSGEGRWTLEEAIDNSVPAPTIAAALFARFSSRQDESPAMKAVASLREQFGGHAVRRADER